MAADALSPGVEMQPEYKPYHSPPSSVKVKDAHTLLISSWCGTNAPGQLHLYLLLH
jgi:hypothetical protein